MAHIMRFSIRFVAPNISPISPNDFSKIKTVVTSALIKELENSLVVDENSEDKLRKLRQLPKVMPYPTSRRNSRNRIPSRSNSPSSKKIV
jgi:hypothetical protein